MTHSQGIFECNLVNLKQKSQPENRPAPINPITMKTVAKIMKLSFFCQDNFSLFFIGSISTNKKASLRTGQPL
jgi:hypothetical protein